MSLSALNVEEIGQTIRVNAAQDISTATALVIRLEPEQGFLEDYPATLGTVDVTVGDETFLANEYAEYVTLEDDLNYSGRWRKKLTVTFSPSSELSTNYEVFRVLP